MKKKLLTLVLGLGLVLTLSAPALAADGVAPTTYGESTGEAVVTYDPELGFQALNDDDDVAQAAETTADGTNIKVWATISSTDNRLYKLDIAWGTMTFQYSGGVGGWDPENHVYTADGTPGWVTTGMVNGDNNRITVTNHSNRRVTASFAYAMNGTPFNDNTGGADAVRGHFFPDNEKALAAAAVLANASAVADQLTYFILPSAEPTGGETVGGPRSDEAYFAFSGTPDAGRELDVFTNVGTVTLTFSQY